MQTDGALINGSRQSNTHATHKRKGDAINRVLINARRRLPVFHVTPHLDICSRARSFALSMREREREKGHGKYRNIQGRVAEGYRKVRLRELNKNGYTPAGDESISNKTATTAAYSTQREGPTFPLVLRLLLRGRRERATWSAYYQTTL